MTILLHASENNQEDRANSQEINFKRGGSELEIRKAKIKGERKGKRKERREEAKKREAERIKFSELGIQKVILSIRTLSLA